MRIFSPTRFNDALRTPTASTRFSLVNTLCRRLRRWRHLRKALTCRCLQCLILVLCVSGFLIFSAVQFTYRQGVFMVFVRVPELRSLAKQLSPPIDKQELPFLDLCLGAEVMETHLQRSSGNLMQRRRRELEVLMDRVNHIPADGGASAVRWSAATGLPIASQRWGEVKARFLTASNKLNDYIHIATTAATMAGVKFEMLGHRWRHFTYHKRMGMMLSYVQLEHLTDADVIVGMDSDALLSGVDVYGFLEAFVASTAASEAEHRSYNLRDIRLGKRLPPFLFGAECNCMRAQITEKHDECKAPYKKLQEMMIAWAQNENVSLTSDYVLDANPLSFLNAGVFVARVWAVRRWNEAFLDFVHTHKPTLGKHWWCDQSAMGTLYLELRRWEHLSGALDGSPHKLTEHEMNNGVIYPPLVIPRHDSGPHGIPAGLVGYERTGRLVLTIGPEMSKRGVFQINGFTVPANNASDWVLDTSMHTAMFQLETSVTGNVQSSHKLHLTPREDVDCHGVRKVGSECAYRDAVLGLELNSTVVTPLIWHFAGVGKRAMISHYRALFPWYTPTMHIAPVRNALLWTLVNAPPTRVFAVEEKTDVNAPTAPVTLLPHDNKDDVSFFQMCTYRFYEGW